MPNDFLADLEATIPELNSNLTGAAERARMPDGSISASRFIAEADRVAPQLADMRGRLTDAADAERFILAGKSTLTLVSVKTGTRFTYRVTVSPDGAAHFVALLNGPDNTADYKYMGRIARSIFWPGRRIPRPGDISKGAPSSLAFDFAWRAVVQGRIPATLEIWHEGRCGRCNRKLTVPSSIKHGFGPECLDRLGLSGLVEDFGS